MPVTYPGAQIGPSSGSSDLPFRVHIVRSSGLIARLPLISSIFTLVSAVRYIDQNATI